MCYSCRQKDRLMVVVWNRWCSVAINLSNLIQDMIDYLSSKEGGRIQTFLWDQQMLLNKKEFSVLCNWTSMHTKVLPMCWRAVFEPSKRTKWKKCLLSTKEACERMMNQEKNLHIVIHLWKPWNKMPRVSIVHLTKILFLNDFYSRIQLGGIF